MQLSREANEHPLCCYKCAPIIELNRRHAAGELPEPGEELCVDKVLEALGWENPFIPGTAKLK